MHMLMFAQGNIGTPTKHFLDLINSCRLPPVVVKKLGLSFKKEGGRFYSTVPYDYGDEKKVNKLYFYCKQQICFDNFV